MQKYVFCPALSRLLLWFLGRHSLRICCPHLLVISSHCEVRTSGSTNGSKKDTLANMGRAGGRVDWGDLCYQWVLQRFARLLKLWLSKAFFPSQGPLPVGLSLPLSLSTCTAGKLGSPDFFKRCFSLKTSTRGGSELVLNEHGWLLRVLLSLDSSCPK